MSIDLDPVLLRQVRAILRQHVPELEVWAFGSRVGRCTKRFADLDLVLLSATELPSRRMAVLAHAFEHSDLPIKVDLLDWPSTPPALRQRIVERHAVVQQPASAPSDA